MGWVIGRLKNALLLFACGAFIFASSGHAQKGGKGNDVGKQTGMPSALVKCVESNNLVELRRLLSSDIDINQLHYDYQTALMIAAQYERVEFVKELIRAGADVSKGNTRSWTALVFAIQRGNEEIVRLLVDAKADVNVLEQTFGYSPLMWAGREGNVEIIEILLAAGANLHQKDKYGKTAFLLAAQGGKPEAVKKFLALGFNANAADEYGGVTALTAASHSPQTLKILIDAGADVNARQKVLAMTALFVAAQNGNTESVKILIDAGADVNIANSDGITPLNRAIIGKHLGVIELLRKAGAKEDKPIKL